MSCHSTSQKTTQADPDPRTLKTLSRMHTHALIHTQAHIRMCTHTPMHMPHIIPSVLLDLAHRTGPLSQGPSHPAPSWPPCPPACFLCSLPPLPLCIVKKPLPLGPLSLSLSHSQHPERLSRKEGATAPGRCCAIRCEPHRELRRTDPWRGLCRTQGTTSGHREGKGPRPRGLSRMTLLAPGLTSQTQAQGALSRCSAGAM